ncbi:hypothetical protein [Paludisphaera rhizosphaerae]|uniref:hypothetical protein n=1 Tax=Paludisphaera rhizosphaerae TaxID=2711216 RepID=UPI0013EB46EB|nr:hypothetical protein [Paludisphaera rhizosphaerae]
MTPRAGRIAAALLAVLFAGCADGRLSGLASPEDDDRFRIATSWPRPDRARLAKEFADWLVEHRDEVNLNVGAIAWVETSENGPTARDLRSLAPPPDVLLGGPVAGYARLASEGRLESLGDGAPRPFWVVSRSTPIGLPEASNRLALADPREDAEALAWCLGRTDAEGWSRGYAGLLDLYGSTSSDVGWRSGSARADLESGRADRTVGVLENSPFHYEEGAGVPRGARRSKAARAFLRFLVERQGARMGPELEGPNAAGATADVESLAADLLGATLVDAREELATAVAAVRKAGSPVWALERLTQPPPWPPASIEKLLERGGERGLALVETLMNQVAPDPGLRDWLARNWLKPRRDLDREVFAEIAGVDGGRLAREPRFRAWLRAEWTQWARQRYRWVARLAAASPTRSNPPVSVPSES